jgi:FkbM family methyltransferase
MATQPIEPFVAPFAATDNRVRFVCDLKDRLCREACFIGYYEAQETRIIKSLLKPGDTFVDVGANWGCLSLVAADSVGTQGRVVALEPHPGHYAILEANRSLNRMDQMTCLRIAATDARGEMTLADFHEAEADNRGTSRLVPQANSSHRTFSVPTDRLEAMLDSQGIDQVDLLKIDIEGAEALVLPTLRPGLARGRYRHILLELHVWLIDQFGATAESLIGLLLEHGYRAWRIDHSPEVSRRAAYALPESMAEILKPLDPAAPIDAWPHFLFVAPGVDSKWK